MACNRMMLCAVVVVALLLSLSTDGVCAVKPGFQARITQHALDYANQKAVASLAADVRKAKIPNQSGGQDHMSYSLTNIQITDFIPPSSSIKLVPNVGLSWSASNAGISMKSNWHVSYRKGWFHISTSGSVDASVTGVSFSLTIALDTDSTGRFSVKAGSCRCSIGSVHVRIHGDLSFLLNLFRGEVEKRVRALLPGKICDAASTQINTNAEKELKKIKVLSHLLNHQFTLDYRLVASPSFQPAYMETFHKGEITWATDPQPPPFPPAPLPPSPFSKNMLYLWVGEYVPQSFLYAAQKHGFLRYNMTTRDLLPEDRAFLNTTCTDAVLTCVGLLFPPVAEKYPGLTITLHMNSTTVPQVNMSPDVLQAQMEGDIALYVNTPVGPSPYLLTMGVKALFNMTAKVNDQLIRGNITGYSFKAKVVDSIVGPVKSKVVEIMVRFAMRTFIIPKINEQGMHGYPLPITDSVKFQNTQLQIQQNALMIGTDLLYNFHL
ncbi:bactericidal permeability-increasing protein-like [Babylonia areolata]|uniref:bactericidal permeability-increasing protein-like n=1 Tax=Babylonia areolata TaxID=304850 RepID=UPI003FD3A995